MRTYTVTQREGEYLGPIDWSWFEENPPRDRYEEQIIAWLKDIEADKEAWLVSNDGGAPKMWHRRVIQIGMYDGWPYWKPRPALRIEGPLGPEWVWWDRITEVIPARREAGKDGE